MTRKHTVSDLLLLAVCSPSSSLMLASPLLQISGYSHRLAESVLWHSARMGHRLCHCCESPVSSPAPAGKRAVWIGLVSVFPWSDVAEMSFDLRSHSISFRKRFSRHNAMTFGEGSFSVIGFSYLPKSNRNKSIRKKQNADVLWLPVGDGYMESCWNICWLVASEWLCFLLLWKSLILSFCRANASRTSSRVLGPMESPGTCAPHTLSHLLRAPALLMEFVCAAGGKPSCPQPRLNCPGGGPSMACEAAWRKSKHIYLVASALFNFLLSASLHFPSCQMLREAVHSKNLP